MKEFRAIAEKGPLWKQIVIYEDYFYLLLDTFQTEKAAEFIVQFFNSVLEEGFPDMSFLFKFMLLTDNCIPLIIQNASLVNKINSVENRLLDSIFQGQKKASEKFLEYYSKFKVAQATPKIERIQRREFMKL